MIRIFIIFILLLLIGTVCLSDNKPALEKNGSTRVAIKGDMFFINDRPTYERRFWQGHKIEGLLSNSRMVQGIFDDSNPDTRKLWKYPDTGQWDPARNTMDFIEAMPKWRNHGLLAFTLNLQGGSPIGYGNKGWVNSQHRL